MRLIITVLCSVFLTANLITAQQPEQSTLDKAITLYRNGQIESALQMFEKAHQENPGDIGILKTLGQIKANQSNWGDAKDWMNKVLKIHPQDLTARYILGISHRESGKFKALIFRKLEWDKAKKHFNYIIEQDSLFKDVFYQYGILERYARNFKKAVSLLNIQVKLKPSDLYVITDLYLYYDFLLANTNFDDSYEWLKKQPQTFINTYYIGELYRRNEQFVKSDSIFHLLLNTPESVFSNIPIYLSLVKTNFVKKDNEKAQDFYYQAIDSVNSILDISMLFQDVKYIITDHELAQFEQLKTIDQRKVFIKNLWARKNPAPAAKINYRLIEHVNRIMYADENYRYDGLKVWFNNPDKKAVLKFPKVFSLDDKYNDKGLVYIRHGEPDNKAFTMDQALQQRVGDKAIQPNESWLYYSSNNLDKMIFHFTIDKNAAGNNWRLTGTIDPKQAANMLNWDPVFQRMYSARTDLDITQINFELEQKIQKETFVGLNSDRHKWEKGTTPLFIPFYMSSFKGDSTKNRYEIYYGLETKNLWSDDIKYEPDINIELGISIHDTLWNIVFNSSKNILSQTIKHQNDSLGIWIDQYNIELDPVNHYLSFFANIPKQKRIGGYKFLLAPVSFNKPTVMISDIELARDIKPFDKKNKFSKHGLQVIPNPTLAFKKNNSFFVYFELYNIPVKNNQNVLYYLEYNLKLLKKEKSNIFSKIAGIFGGGKPKTTIKVERYSNQEFSAEYIALDLSKYNNGHYQLEVIAEFPESEQKVTKTMEFNLSD